jgi:hypothetical protein
MKKVKCIALDLVFPPLTSILGPLHWGRFYGE